MAPSSTALILVGYQNDYFAADGILRPVLEDTARTDEVLARTLRLLDALKNTPVTMIATPIIFSANYSEISQSDGILRSIKDLKAFQAGTRGAEPIPELAAFGDRIIEVPGKRGLNAYSNTRFGKVLEENQVENVIMAGAMTSICIDATGRSAHERGKSIVVLEDCTAARTRLEQEFFCSTIFPTYASVKTADEVLVDLGLQAA